MERFPVKTWNILILFRFLGNVYQLDVAVCDTWTVACLWSALCVASPTVCKAAVKMHAQEKSPHSLLEGETYPHLNIMKYLVINRLLDMSQKSWKPWFLCHYVKMFENLYSLLMNLGPAQAYMWK